MKTTQGNISARGSCETSSYLSGTLVVYDYLVPRGERACVWGPWVGGGAVVQPILFLQERRGPGRMGGPEPRWLQTIKTLSDYEELQQEQQDSSSARFNFLQQPRVSG